MTRCTRDSRAGTLAGLCAVVVLTLPATGAKADDVLRRVQMPRQHGPDCYCRAQGRFFALGETICLRTGDGPRIAQCSMAINVTSWRITTQPCPDS